MPYSSNVIVYHLYTQCTLMVRCERFEEKGVKPYKQISRCRPRSLNPSHPGGMNGRGEVAICAVIVSSILSHAVGLFACPNTIGF